MVETKSVKVDNWGVFFLQKLQNFFNKTDYCDLTLQFMDNSQLKVHRLVLSACTDYFNVLEQQTDCQDDILNMPYDLQADVVVPIVNFMYTGTLEFEVNMYGRLLKTAKDMNMTVLLKLLEAHKRTVDVQQQPTAARNPPVLLNKGVGHVSVGGGGSQYHRGGGGNQSVGGYTRIATGQQAPQSQRYATANQLAQRKTIGGGQQQPQQQQQRPKVVDQSSAPVSRLGVRPAVPAIRKAQHLPDTVRVVAKATAAAAASSRAAAPPSRPGPSRFDGGGADGAGQGTSGSGGAGEFESQFDSISYESRPLTTARQLIKEESADDGTMGGFEQLRRGYTGVNKRPVSAASGGAPGGRDSPPEKKPNIEDVKEYIEAHRMRKKIVEEFNEDDDDEEEEEKEESTAGSKRLSAAGSADDNSVDHQKIISEVLKKYPHLVKGNKNIKLKITQKGQQQTITAPLRLPAAAAASAAAASKPAASTSAAGKPTAATAPGKPPAAATAPKPVVSTPAPAPKKIESKTMHALIAKGPENTTGPWLCLKCGVNGRPISIPSYKGFRRHLINVHKLKIDPKLCEHCGWRSAHKTELLHHQYTVHSLSPPPDVRFPKCPECGLVAVDARELRTHQLEQHAPKAEKAQQHCIYCNKTFADEQRLFDHIKTVHKERACEDGLMDEDAGEEEEDDDEMGEDEDEEYVPPKSAAAAAAASVPEKRKINVLSSITLPAKGAYVLDKVAAAAAAKGTTATTTTSSISTASKTSTISGRVAGAASTSSPQPQTEAAPPRRSGTLDPVTGTFIGEDDEDAEDSPGQADSDAEQAAKPQAAAQPVAAAAAAISQEEADSHAYLEFVMAEVHGEKKPPPPQGAADADAAASAPAKTASAATTAAASGTTDPSSSGPAATRFVTEDGAAVELTEQQKKELIDQLHDQSGVLVILKDEGGAAAAAGAEPASDVHVATSGVSTAAATTVSANQSLDELAQEWELDASADSARSAALPDSHDDDEEEEEEEAAEAKRARLAAEAAKAAAAVKAKELIGDWSADEETDESQQPDESGAAAQPEAETEAEAANPVAEAAKPSEPEQPACGDASATAADAGKSGTEAADAAATTSGGVAAGQSAAAQAKRSYAGRGSRDSNKDVAEQSPPAKVAKLADGGEEAGAEGDREVAATSASSAVAVAEERREIDEPKRDAETMKKDSNIEIKSLINEWGEDDEEDEQMEKE